jgi:hypothetical protein
VTANEKRGEYLSKTTKKADAKALTKPYEATPHEREVIQAYLDGKRENPPPPRVAISWEDERTCALAPDHPQLPTGQLLLMDALGVKDWTLGSELLTQMSAVAAGNEETLNGMIALVKGLEPKDTVEATLAAQMASVHVLTMTLARRLANTDTIQQQDSAERALNKLARTFTTQIETLNRHRGKGQQKVTVEHVHVHQGGQAIVGNVERSPESKHQGKTDAGVPNATTHGPRKSEPTQ